MAENRTAARAKVGARSPARVGDPGGEQRFPPLSTSLETFLVDGSDREFRKLIYGLLSVSSLMLRARERFAAYIGVTAPQYSMMVAIGEAEQITVTQLADRLHVSSPFVTAEIGKLIKRHIVERRPNEADRRSSLLVLTPTGQDLIRRLGPYRRMGNDLVFGSLRSDQAGQLQQIVATLLIDAERALHELDNPSWRNHEAHADEGSATRERPRRERARR